MAHDGATLFGRPIDRRELLALTGKVLAGGTVAGTWLSPELAGYVHAAARGEATGGSVTVMSQWSPPGLGTWKPYFDAFTKETGIKLTIDDQNYNNQYQKITTQGQAGNPTDDVVAIDTIWTGSFSSAGFTLDLNDFLPASVKSQIAQPSLDSVSYKGKAYAVPNFNSSKHFYYNKKMLAAVGFNRPPKTLDELVHYCEVLKANKAKLGIQYPTSWSWKQLEALTCDFVVFTDGLGGRFYAPDNVTPAFNKGAGVRALTLMKMMLDKGYAAPGSLTHVEGDVENDLLSGKIAMGISWEGPIAHSNDPKATVKDVLGQIGIALIPGSSGKVSGSCLGPQGFAIMKASKHIPEAKAFVNWQVGKAAQKQAMLINDQFPVYNAMYGDTQLRKLVQSTDHADTFATYGQQFAYSQARPNFPGYLDASARLQVHLHKAFLGQETPQKALDNAAAEMTKATGNGGSNP